MAVIVTDMKIPIACYECEFATRVSNMHSLCNRHPQEPPVVDGEPRPEHCPLEEYQI